MTQPLRPSAQRQFLVKVQGIDGFFAQKTGGDVASEPTRVHDGGSLRPAIITSPPQAEDITTGRPYDAERDQPFISQLRSLVGSFETTISVTPTDPDMIPIAPPTVYSNARLIRMNEPEADADSGDAARWELVWAVPEFN